MTNNKKIIVVLSSILLLASLVVNVWFVWLKLYGKEKTVSFTTEFGSQVVVTPDGETENQPVFEISYWPNAMEIKVNTIFDEKADKYYYYGVQYLAYSLEETNLFRTDYKDVLTSNNWTNPFRNVKHYDRTWKNAHSWSVSKREYMSDDNWATSIQSTMDLSSETMLKIKSGDNLFGLEMVGVKPENTTYHLFMEKSLTNYHEYYHDYFNYNWDYLFYEFYNAVKDVKAGTSQYITMKFGDIFNVKQHEGNGTYVEIVDDYNFDSLIKTDKVTYITTKINVYDELLNSSADSSIGWCNDSQTYNVESEQNGYFMGRDIISLSLSDFDMLVDENKVVTLKLSNNFVNYYLKYADKIYLDILIDVDELTNAGYTFNGVLDDGFEEFNIKSSKIQYLEDGLLKVVDYELL